MFKMFEYLVPSFLLLLVLLFSGMMIWSMIDDPVPAKEKSKS